MASFFRKRIAQKVLSVLQAKQELTIPNFPNVISSSVKLNRLKSSEPKLILPWRRIEQVCNQTLSVSPNDLVRLLRNQGLPTAEGFINIELLQSPLSLIFTVDKHIFSKIVLLDICSNEDDLAKSSCLFENIKRKNIVVHCSVPPIGGPFHFTHFRSVIHCNYIANINRFVGHNVIKVAHVKDWGLEAAAFLTGYKKFKTGEIRHKKGDFYLSEIKKAALLEYKNNYKFKEDVDSFYDKMERGDSKVLSEWEDLKQLCINFYDSIYKRIDTSFDHLHFDSAYCEKSNSISAELLRNSSLFINEDCLEANSNNKIENKFYINNMIENDSILYDFSRNITAAIELKHKYKFDDMYFVAPSSQKDFLEALFYLINKLNYACDDELHHVSLKMLSSFDSKRMKNMNIGTILDQIKDNMTLKLHEKLHLELNESLEEMSEHLGLSSLIVNDMKQRRNVNYIFDWLDIISLKKNTGASFQFCYAGLKGLQEDSEFKFKNDIDTSPLLEPGAHYLIQHLARFDEMVYKSYSLLEPCFIYQYLSSLWFFTDQITNVLKLDIKEDRLIVIKARLLLLSATLKILNRGLNLLGITPLQNVYSPEESFATTNK